MKQPVCPICDVDENWTVCHYCLVGWSLTERPWEKKWEKQKKHRSKETGSSKDRVWPGVASIETTAL